MVQFNSESGLTLEADREIRRFIDQEFDGIDQDALKALAGGDYYFENIEELTPRTLRCDTCNHEIKEDVGILDEEGESVLASDGRVCPECLKDAPLACDICGKSFEGHKLGDICPDCPGGDNEAPGELLQYDVSDRGSLEYIETDEHGFFPMWNRMWKCGAWVARKIRNDVSIASNAGFNVYEVQEELYLGVNGADYGFYEAHWAPLWRAMFDGPLPGDPVECPACEGHYAPEAGDCPTCKGKGEGKVPHESFEMKRERQRSEAMEFLQTVCIGATEYDVLQDEAKRILDITKE